MQLDSYFYLLSLTGLTIILFRSAFIILINKAINIPVIHPFNTNLLPSTKLVNLRIITFINKLLIPKVNILIGSIKYLRNGFKYTLNKLIIILAKQA